MWIMDSAEERAWWRDKPAVALSISGGLHRFIDVEDEESLRKNYGLSGCFAKASSDVFADQRLG